MDKDAYLYVTSPFFAPTILGSIRLVFCLYTQVTLVLFFIFGWKGQNADASSFFAIFSVMSYIGVCAYFGLSSFHTLMYARGKFPLESSHKLLKWAHVWLLSSVVSFPIVITIIYYPVFGNKPLSSLDSWCWISMHGINAFFALFEIFLTNAPPGPWRILIGNLLLIVGYLGIAFITRDTKGFNDTFLSAYIAILFAGEVVVFAVVQGLMILRRWAVERAGWTNRFAGGVGGWHRVNNMTNEFAVVEGSHPQTEQDTAYYGRTI